jgi:molybdopterin molybdotransferase
MDIEARVATAWARIETWLKSDARARHAALRAPATADAIAQAEAAMGVRLPDDVRALYRIHDGQADGSCGILGGWVWLDTFNLVAEWSDWKELFDDGALNDESSAPDQGVRGDWWNPKWVPLTLGGSGGHHCIDLAPDEKGTVGQIIKVHRDLPRRPRIAGGLAEWLETLARELESGERTFDEDNGGLFTKDESLEES